VQATETFPLPLSDDARLLEGLRAREVAGFSEVYAAYGARLYDYAVWMLQDPSAAEDAVLDSMLVAVDRAARLPAPDRFAAWLYALTRNECLRQVRRGARALVLRTDGPTQRHTTIDVDRGGPAWAWRAAGTLDARSREVLDLSLRHALDPAQIAQVLGTSARRIRAIRDRACGRLQRVALELRAADPTEAVCGELRTMLVGRDGPLPDAIQDMVGIHRAICAACIAASQGQPHAADVFSTLPATPLPPALHSIAVRAATIPSRVSSRGEMAEPFRRSGFPVPLERTERRGGRVLVAGAVAVAVVLAGAGWLVTLHEPSKPREQWRSVEAASSDEVSQTPSGAVTSVAGTVPRWRPIPNPSPSRPAPGSTTGAPIPTNSPPSQAPPRPQPVERGTGRPVQVDPLLADTTIGCPQRWRAKVTAFVRFNRAREVTLFWGENDKPNRRISMRKVTDSLFEVDATNLPLNRPVYWRVTAISVDGHRTVTPVNMIRRDDLCDGRP
jgi:DNA-directed RNA polymerase specialized sigma24 family protein